MPQYAYRASNARGEIHTGVITKNSRQEAISYLRAQEFFPLELVETTQGKVEEIAGRQKNKKVKRKELLILTQQLSSLLKSGVQLDKALLITADLFKRKPLGDVIEDIWQNVQAGKSLSEALYAHPHVFPIFYQNMIKAGEFSGVLPLVMDRLAAFIEEEYELRSFLVSSLTYPAMISMVSISAFAIILVYVIPKFESMFAMMNQELPAITQMIMFFSNFLRTWWFIPVLLIIAGAVGLYSYWQTPEGRVKIDRWRLAMPLVGDLYLKVQTARMARTFSIMLAGGVPILKALSILQESMSNKILAGAIEEIKASLRKGGSIAKEMKKQAVFPTIAVHMISIGEESSNLEGMLDRLAKLYDTEVKNTLRGLLSLLEPVMILTLAVGIGIMLISILIPLMSISNIS